MRDHRFEPLLAAATQSELVRAVRSVRADGGRAFALPDTPVRPLTADEVRRLTADGNTAESWGRVLVAQGFRPGRVRHCDFRGDVVLGCFDGTARGPGGVELPAGVSRSTVADTVIGHGALVRNVGLLSGYVVGRGACVSDCGRVVCDGPTTFGNGVPVTIGPQTGGRGFRAFAELTLDLADALTSDPGASREHYAAGLATYLDAVRSDRGVIGPGAVVAHVAAVTNTFVGPAAEVDAATRVENSTLLSSAAEPVVVRDGAVVLDSVVQWGGRVVGPAVVERAVLLEQSAVERFGKVTDSVIGPNTGVGGAEVTASLVGPFVGCHHQGMLIAARWPAGRGNLGYGAGVGCNHTSRAPDQEAVLGEGLFVGLGAKVQYPLDLARAPYTVLACGVSLPPQRVAFPFSLIRAAAEAGVAPGANVLVPAWMLSDNLYAVQRAALKYRTRDRAARHRLEHQVFRPAVMDLVADACERLERAGGKDVYTERDVPGLGRNVLFERHRAAAVTCYRAHLERCALLRQLDHAAARPDDHGWQLDEALARLSELLEDFAAAVEQSKARDEQRGPLVIDDYADAHGPTEDDPVVRATWDEVRATQARIARARAAGRPGAVTLAG